jgi:hypothetical protein
VLCVDRYPGGRDDDGHPFFAHGHQWRAELDLCRLFEGDRADRHIDRRPVRRLPPLKSFASLPGSPDARHARSGNKTSPQTPVALTYDSGDYFTTLEMALKAADYSGFEQRRQDSARQGKLRGIGIATYIEACAMAPSVLAGQLGARAGFYETAEVHLLRG